MKYDFNANRQGFMPLVVFGEDGQLDFSNLAKYVEYLEDRVVSSLEEADRQERRRRRIVDQVNGALDEATWPSDEEVDEVVECIPVKPQSQGSWDWPFVKKEDSNEVKESGTQTEAEEDVQESPASPDGKN